ncbi:hypothetical protein Tco_0245926 [Tanacetum coccineum]
MVKYQKEVNEIRAERIAKNANPLALVAVAQQYPDPYYQAPKSHKPYAPTSKQSSSTRSNASTKFKGKEIAKPITPPSESASEEDSDPEQAQRDKDMQKNLALIAKNQRIVTIAEAKETVGSQETKKGKDYTYHKEKMLLCKQAEKDSVTNSKPLEKVQYDAEYNVFANDKQHSEQHESINSTCVVEKYDSNVITDSSDMCDNDIQNDQNAKECDDERVALANLITNLTLDTEENKKILKILKPSVLGKPTLFSESLKRKIFSKTKSVPKTNVLEGLSKPVTTLILPQTARQGVRNTNVIKPGIYRIDTRTTQTRSPQLTQTSRNTNPRVSTSIGVIHKTNVSRPQLRSTQMKDTVVPNNSQVKDKKTEVEDHPKISSISNKTKSVTACNDSLKSRTSNVNVVCATCGKCVFNSNHDACVSKFLNGVNARTKKPKVVPISTRQPKSQAKKSIATPPKKTVASESTI